MVHKKTDILTVSELFSVGVRTSNIISSALTVPFTMSDFKEKLQYFKCLDVAHKSCESMKSSRSMGLPVSFKRSEEEREDPPAKRPEIRELELLEERLAFFEELLSSREPGPNIPPSSSTIPFTMGGVEEDEWSEEEREDPPAKRPEIRKLESKEERLAFIRKLLWSCGHGPNFPPSPRRSNPEKIRAGSPASSCESMKSSRSMELPVTFNRKDFVNFKRIFNITNRSKSNPEKIRAGSPASSCESMKSSRSMGLPVTFKQ
ncbi:hypothetical protein NQZ68_020122 [Dissostichus eleginoides]|nr:hypothetical protein NQZ68_020122 [Dissostichus eleginoides]